jgi:hypothetical protein
MPPALTIYVLQYLDLLQAMQLRNSNLPAARSISNPSVHAPLNEKPQAHAMESMHMHSEDSNLYAAYKAEPYKVSGNEDQRWNQSRAPPASCRACIYRSEHSWDLEVNL